MRLEHEKGLLLVDKTLRVLFLVVLVQYEYILSLQAWNPTWNCATSSWTYRR